MNDLAIAWAAGLFEGEGCITHQKDNSHQIVVTVTSTDPDVLDRFGLIVGCGTVRPRPRPLNPRWKRPWQWCATGDAAVAVLMQLLPYFGERRTSRACELLEYRATYIATVTQERSCEVCGVMFRPRFHAKSAATRFCSPNCKAEHNRLWTQEYKRRKAAL